MDDKEQAGSSGTASEQGAAKESASHGDIKRLIRNRGTIKHKLTILEKYIISIKANLPQNKPSFNDVDLRYKNGSILLQEFDQVQSMIESLCEEKDLGVHYEEREEFQERFYVTQDFLIQYLNNERESFEFCTVE